jgi:hypothetical protein
VGARVVQLRWLRYKSWPALEAVSEVGRRSHPMSLRTRIIIQGRRHYSLMVVGAEPSSAKRFFDSLELAPPADTFRFPHRTAVVTPSNGL